MTPRDLATLVLILALIGIALTVALMGVVWFVRWALDREADRQANATAAAKFEADFIPEAQDVAATERDLKVTVVADTSKFTESLARFVEANQALNRRMAEHRACAALDEIEDMLSDVGLVPPRDDTEEVLAEIEALLADATEHVERLRHAAGLQAAS